MSAPICTIAKFNNSIFQTEGLDPLTRKAVFAWLLAYELQLLGGTNYLNTLTSPAAGGLVGDTISVLDKASDDQIGTRMIGTFELAIAYNNCIAYKGGIPGGLPTTANGLRAQAVCLVNVNEKTLDKIILYLTCALGYPNPFPQ